MTQKFKRTMRESYRQDNMITEIIGMFGAILAGVAYLPQITHLIKEHCSAGISRRAYMLWLFSSVAILIHAIAIMATVFIILSGLQLVATFLILFFSEKYKGTCAFHARMSK